MKNKLRDLGFTFALIFLIAIGMYWILEQLQDDYLDQYINILGEKLIAMVPESSEKRALYGLFEGFKSKVDKNEVTPEQVERIAADIFNVTTLQDSLTLAEASALIEIAEPADPVLEVPEERRWRQVEQKLERLYRFEQRVLPDVQFHVDRQLKILIDDSTRVKILEKKDEALRKEIELLRQSESLIFVHQLDSNFTKMHQNLIQIRMNDSLPDMDKIREIQEVLIVTMDSVETDIAIKLDSLHNVYEYQIKTKRKAEVENNTK